jgi:hypothetical protein
LGIPSFKIAAAHRDPQRDTNRQAPATTADLGDFHLPDSPPKAKLPVIGSRIRGDPVDQAAVTEAMDTEKRDPVEEKGVTAGTKTASDMTVGP